MKVQEISTALNIPIIDIIEFFDTVNQDIDTYKILNDYQVMILMQNLEMIRENVSQRRKQTEKLNENLCKVSAKIPVLTAPKVVGKIDLDSMLKIRANRGGNPTRETTPKSLEEKFYEFETDLELLEQEEFAKLQIEIQQQEKEIDDLLRLPKHENNYDVPEMEAVIMGAIKRGDGDLLGY